MLLVTYSRVEHLIEKYLYRLIKNILFDESFNLINLVNQLSLSVCIYFIPAYFIAL